MMKCWAWSLPISLLAVVVLAAAEKDEARPRPADWPQFRGPNRDNLSPDKGLLKEWPTEGPPLVWPKPPTGLGGGYSTVSVAGNRIFTLGNRGDSTYVFALDRESGEKLWEAKVGKPGDNTGCTPTVDGELLYAIGQQGDLVCLETATGQERWRKHFTKDFKGRCGGWSYTESPLVDSEKLVCTPGGAEATLVALNKKTGEVIWQAAVPEGETTAGYSSIVIATVGGIRQYVQLIAGGVVGIRAKDGQFLWRYDKFANNTANIPTPIVKGDLVFCAAGYGKGGALLKLAPTDEGTKATELYYHHELKNKHGGLVLVGDHVYGDHDESGRPFCADLMTGKVTAGWQKPRKITGSGSAAVTYADGHLYVRYKNGVVALVEATPEGYREKGTLKIPKVPGPSWAHPVVVGGRLYLRESDALWCYDVTAR